jgi:hypothetical protein
MASIETRQKTDVRSPLGGFTRKMMAGFVALSVAAMGLPAISTSAQADGYYGYDYGYSDYGYAPHGHYSNVQHRARNRAERQARREARRALRAERRANRAHRNHRQHYYYGHHDDDDDEAVAAVAGAVIGLAIGAIIASEANRHDHRANQYRSYATPPQRQPRSSAHQPQIARQWSVAPDPFTDEWYDYCAERYRSFDPETGTFQPYEGPRKLCR